MMEAIIYNAILSDVDRDKITGYLADKWDITSTTNSKGSILKLFEPETDAIFAAMGTTPDVTRKILIDNLVSGLKTDGIWSKLDFFYILAAHAENSSLLNWINPGTFDATNVSSTAFEVDRGYTGDGSADYLNSNYNPTNNAINYALNSASFGVYVRTDVDETGRDIGATSTGLYNELLLRTVNNFYIALNDGAYDNVANTDSRGFFIASREGANILRGYKDKLQAIDVARVSVNVVDLNFYILCRNNSGPATDFSTKQIAAAFAGGGMTQTQVNNFNDRLKALLTSIGAAV